jgi:hypothetical protein
MEVRIVPNKELKARYIIKGVKYLSMCGMSRLQVVSVFIAFNSVFKIIAVIIPEVAAGDVCPSIYPDKARNGIKIMSVISLIGAPIKFIKVITLNFLSPCSAFENKVEILQINPDERINMVKEPEVMFNLL